MAEQKQHRSPSNVSTGSPSPPSDPPPPSPSLPPPSGRTRYPNPPDTSNPDPSTLREQWRFAIRQYSRWYSHAWGTALLAGAAFFALGWAIKGSNPLPSRSISKSKSKPNDGGSDDGEPQ